MFGRKSIRHMIADFHGDMLAAMHNSRKTRDKVDDFDLKIEMLRDEIRSYRREVERLQKSTMQSLLVIDKGQIKPLLMVMENGSNHPVVNYPSYHLGELAPDKKNILEGNGLSEKPKANGMDGHSKEVLTRVPAAMRHGEVYPVIPLAGPKGRLP